MLRVYNRFLDLLTETSSFQSLQYPIDFHGVGQFELHINENLHGAEHMQKDNVIALSSHKAGIIQTIENTLGGDGKASETIKVSGYTTDGIMSKRATIPPKDKSHDTINDDAETVMKHYAEKHFLNPDDPDRKFPNFMIAPNRGRGKKIKWESRFKNVAEELEEISKETGLGWCVYLDFRAKKYIFDVVESKDLTQSNSQGNNPVFFSPDFGTIKSQTFIDSDNDLRNFAYIGGQGEGVDRKIVTIGEAKGWDRIETFIDARDVSDEYDRDDDEYDEDADNNKRPEEEIEQDLIDRGNKKMEDMQRLLSFEAEILTPVTRKSYEYESDGYIYHAQPRRRAVVKNTTITPFEYEVDFNIGDIVDVFNKKWGVSLSTPIVEILEIHEQGGFRIEATFGDIRPTITKKLKRKFDDIEDIDKQEKYYEYVDKKKNEVVNEITPSSEYLWEGVASPSENSTIRPSKRLSECVNGWKLQWQRYESGDGTIEGNYQYSYIPKSHAKHHNGLGINFTLSRSNVTRYKYVYVYDDKIEGYSRNYDGDNRNLALTGVEEW